LIAIMVSVLIMAACLFGKNSHYAVLAEGGFVIAMLVIMIVCQAVL
jgi:hypothetical protein